MNASRLTIDLDTGARLIAVVTVRDTGPDDDTAAIYRPLHLHELTRVSDALAAGEIRMEPIETAPL